MSFVRNATQISLALAAIALGACNSKADGNSADAPANSIVDTSGNSAMDASTNSTAANVSETAGAGSVLTADFMKGKWSAFGECSDTIEFKADGTLIMPFGEGKWSLSGNQLTFSAEGSPTQSSPVKVIDPNTIEVTKGSNGKTETQKRC